jgi:hypothetical protein
MFYWKRRSLREKKTLLFQVPKLNISGKKREEMEKINVFSKNLLLKKTNISY